MNDLQSYGVRELYADMRERALSLLREENMSFEDLHNMTKAEQGVWFRKNSGAVILDTFNHLDWCSNDFSGIRYDKLLRSIYFEHYDSDKMKIISKHLKVAIGLWDEDHLAIFNRLLLCRGLK